MQILPVPEDEYIFCHDIRGLEMENACVGDLVGDFGASGMEFWESWNGHNLEKNASKQALYKNEVANVILALRENGLLKDRYTMARHMARWSKAVVKSARSKQIALRIETKHQRLYLRCNPGSEDFDFYLYAYDRKKLMYIEKYPYEIYQSDCPDFTFLSWKYAKDKIDVAKYRQVYSGKMYSWETLEKLYELHNTDSRPNARKMRSMSVSDIVVTHVRNNARAYYVDSIGFERVDNLLPELKKLPPLRKDEPER